jgi:predicted Zn finger-like uncharacterized protein
MLPYKATMVRTEPFKCPNCGTLYQVIKADAGPETVDAQVSCRTCGAALKSRDGPFVLKYFLIWNPRQLRRA